MKNKWKVDWGHRLGLPHKWAAYQDGWASVTRRGFDTKKAALEYAKQQNKKLAEEKG